MHSQITDPYSSLRWLELTHEGFFPWSSVGVLNWFMSRKVLKCPCFLEREHQPCLPSLPLFPHPCIDALLLSSILMQFLTFWIKTKVKKKMTQSRKQPVVLWLFLSSLLWQINRAPSFGTDQKIDYDVKKGVLLNALKLLNIRYSSTTTHALTPIIAPRSSALSLFQNLVLPSSINSASTRLHAHLALVAQRPCYAASSSPFCDIAADLQVKIPWFYHGWIGEVEAAEAAFQGINSIMVMLEWMSALFQPFCFFIAAAQLLRAEGLVVCAEVTAPTVSTWDQFIPNRAWTLINLSPPTALRIQFKGPVTDQNELAFFFPDHNGSLVLN